ncbi:MAG: adenylate/guanylate cyclase domain-containing protein [Spirochaetaceae bacterium]|nr:MAG: adenylate/guanylate cyclase domain-containing protein [Spirochaetaceae bacterium]
MQNKGKRLKLLEIQYVGLLIGIIVFIILFFLIYIVKVSFFETIELGLLNEYFKSRYAITKYATATSKDAEGNARDIAISDDIAIYGIDSETLDKLGRFPFPRSVQSKFLLRLARIKDQNRRERAVLYDFFYVEPQNKTEDGILADAIRENGRVFLETTYDYNLQDQDQRQAYYKAEEALHDRYGTLTNIQGDWMNIEPFLGLEPPIKEYAEVIKGYGHASYIQDRDEVYRKAILVARYSQMMAQEWIPVEELREGLLKVSCDRKNYEWLSWFDKNNNVSVIPEEITEANVDIITARIMENARINTLQELGGKNVYAIARFKDSFVPSIVLSLALEYFNKKPSDVEVKIGEYIRIPDIQYFSKDDFDWVDPKQEYMDANTGEKYFLPPYAIPTARTAATGEITQTRYVNEIRIPIDDQGQMLINFMGYESTIEKTFFVRPFWYFGEPDKVPGPDPVTGNWRNSNVLDNKIIIVCAYAKGIAKDEKMTPFGLMYGGEIHANALNTIVMDNFIQYASTFITIIILLAAVALAAFICSRLPPLLSLGISIWLVIVYYYAVIQLFILEKVILNFSAPSIGIMFTFLMIVAYRVIFEERDKRRIKSMFGKYVNPQVVEQLLQNPPELGGVDKEITVLFSDIRGYTTLSESMAPQALVNHLNSYLTRMTDILFEYQGTLDKYVGDMVMGFWGAPLPQAEHAILACKCALKQIEALAELNASWPPERRINIGIGINSGIMVVGNMGSPVRMNYTLMGDNVNLGSRLEGTNKEYGTGIIISEYTYGLVKDRVIVRELDNIRVKGKNKPVLIYELLDVIEGLDPPKTALV